MFIQLLAHIPIQKRFKLATMAWLGDLTTATEKELQFKQTQSSCQLRWWFFIWVYLQSKPIPPEDLVARSCPSRPAVWHLKCLNQLLTNRKKAPSTLLRITFHARWLLHFLAPDDPQWQPKVSIIIPVYNRAEIVGKTIDSALAQTYSSIEVIVIDDGSTDDLDQALEPYRGRIRFARLPENTGVSAARNRGIRMAEGEFLHFLDSDDVIYPDSVARWVAAFRCVADGDLCFAPAIFTDELAEYQGPPPPDGGPDCATTDLMCCLVKKYPFIPTGLMIARWVVIKTGLFDEDLRAVEDTRYWFRLGMNGFKAIGLQQQIGLKYILPVRLSSPNNLEFDRGHSLVWLLNTCDILQNPHYWKYVAVRLNKLLWSIKFFWPCMETDRDPLLEQHRNLFFQTILELNDIGQKCGLSAWPILCLCEWILQTLPGKVPDLGGPSGLFYERFKHAVTDSTGNRTPLTKADRSYWLSPSLPYKDGGNRFVINLIEKEISDKNLY